MRNLFLMFAISFSYFIQAQTVENLKKVQPTLQVTKAFEKDFPKIKPVWRIENNGKDANEMNYDADFTLKNTNLTAVYNALGTFKVLKIEVKQTDILAKINKYMTKNYSRNIIRKASKLMTNNNKITYEIEIMTNGKGENFVFNKDGDFIEMVQNAN